MFGREKKPLTAEDALNMIRGLSEEEQDKLWEELLKDDETDEKVEKIKDEAEATEETTEEATEEATEETEESEEATEEVTEEATEEEPENTEEESEETEEEESEEAGEGESPNEKIAELMQMIEDLSARVQELEKGKTVEEVAGKTYGLGNHTFAADPEAHKTMTAAEARKKVRAWMR